MTTQTHGHGRPPGTDAGHAHGGGYAGYATTWFYLLAITLVEVAIVEAKAWFGLDLPAFMRIGSLIALTVLKAGLIMAYFMHLKFERRSLVLILLVPIVLLVLLYVMILPDAHTFRAVNPGMKEGAGPSHGTPTHAPAPAATPRSGH
ncbi:MAG: hypothetical protein FJX78_07320 [Armatimonadetes bacterium]|nr:hypothetical protein [Armatimonadota bacterium]